MLLQRIGRLHRHLANKRPAGFEQPRAIVLSPSNLAQLLDKRRKDGFGLGGEYGPYRDLVMVEATRRLIEQHAVWCIPDMNRRIVEEATHPCALDALLQELAAKDPRWQRNHQDNEGKAMADAQIAAGARLNWSTGLAESDNLMADERIGTRLGAQDVAVTLPPGTKGPFGDHDIQRLSIPSFWAPSQDLGGDWEPTSIECRGGALRFTIGQSSFRYDWRGLLPLTETKLSGSRG